MHSESDEALMRRVQRDETAAFEVLYDRHAGQALGVARSGCFDAGRAEDAVQESFLSIWRNRERYRPEAGSFKAWAMTIVKHRTIDSGRAAASRPQFAEIQSELPDSETPSVADEVVARDQADLLRASLQGLSDGQSEVITLAFFGELSHSEIASQLGLPLGTVKGRMRLGLEKLRTRMETDERSPAQADDSRWNGPTATWILPRPSKPPGYRSSR
jgi:RNA polymerase sigma-70 factor (ECF subfamily)